MALVDGLVPTVQRHLPDDTSMSDIPDKLVKKAGSLADGFHENSRISPLYIVCVGSFIKNAILFISERYLIPLSALYGTAG